MSRKIGWGIIGTGNIAQKFAEGLKSLDDAVLVAVGSRSKDKAKEIGKLYGSSSAYGSYEEVAADPDVDVVYIATPHVLHKENSRLCLENGKAVLCEKPFTMDAKELEELMNIAAEKGVFLMEAMWTRFLPAMIRIKEILKSKTIGDIRMVKADFGFRSNFNPKSRLFAKELGGGSLLDIGIYTVSFASMVFGKEPEKVASLAHIGETNVDEQAAFLLGYEKGEIAVLSSAIRTTIPSEAFILGTEGYIRIPEFWHASKAEVFQNGNKIEDINMPFKSNGYCYEAEEVMNCIREGKLQSDLMSLKESLSIMGIMDKIENEWRK